MTYSKIQLMQVEKRDIPTLKNFVNELKSLIPEYREVSTSLLMKEYEGSITDPNKYNFVIRAYKEGAFLYTVGFCSIENIEWVSRHGEVHFVMEDGSVPVTIPNTVDSKIAFGKVLEFAFQELNLQKVYMEVLETNNIKSTLDEFGFVAEGVRRCSRLKKGKHIDSTICSLLAQEYRGLQ